mmetsp:Transcript_34634/g.102903  ORF Transcript_34634/g.102903 Transcript_34634/m.102903 type:complete len:229 (+) Transcript_34634:468-1154(+)
MLNLCPHLAHVPRADNGLRDGRGLETGAHTAARGPRSACRAIARRVLAAPGSADQAGRGAPRGPKRHTLGVLRWRRRGRCRRHGHGRSREPALHLLRLHHGEVNERRSIRDKRLGRRDAQDGGRRRDCLTTNDPAARAGRALRGAAREGGGGAEEHRCSNHLPASRWHGTLRCTGCRRGRRGLRMDSLSDEETSRGPRQRSAHEGAAGKGRSHSQRCRGGEAQATRPT